MLRRNLWRGGKLAAHSFRGRELGSIQSFDYNRIVRTAESIQIPESPEPGMIRLLMRIEIPNALFTPSIRLSCCRGECKLQDKESKTDIDGGYGARKMRAIPS